MSASSLFPPKNINPHAVDLWFSACSYARKMNWSARSRTLHKFVELCDSAGLSAFMADNEDPNPAIKNFLGKRRRLYVRYIDSTGFLNKVYVRKIFRDAYLTDYGFAIKIEAWVSLDDATYNWFRKIKSIPAWRFSLMWDKEHRYTLKLDPGITVYVRNPIPGSKTSWYVGYEIHCPLAPKLPNLKPDTILKNLWDSMALSVRPKNSKPQRRL